jgi:hypothetical protein
MRGKPICLLALALIGFPVLADPPTLSFKLAASTPLYDYRTHFCEKVSQRWYSEMAKNNKGSLRYGTVKIHFKVHSDGTISDLSILEGDSAGLLKTVSINVLLDSAPFPPFSDALVKEMGATYVDDMTFTASRPSTRDMTPAEAERRVPVPPPD